MSGLNKAMLIGRLGADPEVKHMPNGDAVCNWRMATTEKWTGKDGKPGERTEWHRCFAWGKLAEICGKYLCKGKQCYVEGEIQTRQWEKDGEKRYSTEIKARSMQLLGSKGDGSKTQDDDAPPPPADTDNTPF